MAFEKLCVLIAVALSVLVISSCSGVEAAPDWEDPGELAEGHSYNPHTWVCHVNDFTRKSELQSQLASDSAHSAAAETVLVY